MDSSALLNNMHGALWIVDSSQPMNLTGNVVYEAYDKSAIMVDRSTGNIIQVGSSSLPGLMAKHAVTCPPCSSNIALCLHWQHS